MKEKDFFNSIADSWDETNDSSTPDKINAIMELSDIRPGQNILDIGTGTGILLPYLAERTGPSGSITAVDMAEKMLERARNKYSGISPAPRFILADVERDEIDGLYDRIMLYCVFPHIHNPEDTLLRLASRNLKPEGEIIIAHPSSRQFINDIHHERPIHSEGLAAGAEVKERLGKVGLHTDVIADNDSIYLLRIRKQPLSKALSERKI